MNAWIEHLIVRGFSSLMASLQIHEEFWVSGYLMRASLKYKNRLNRQCAVFMRNVEITQRNFVFSFFFLYNCNLTFTFLFRHLNRNYRNCWNWADV